MSNADPSQDAESTAPIAAAGLSAFQEHLLVAVAAIENAEESPYGLAIKSRLEDYYRESINHGRLYPNLDELVDEGYLRKGQLDRRTNSYELTEEGRELIESHRDWLTTLLDER